MASPLNGRVRARLPGEKRRPKINSWAATWLMSAGGGMRVSRRTWCCGHCSCRGVNRELRGSIHGCVHGIVGNERQYSFRDTDNA